MVEDQLRLAADFIRSKRYDEARRLLVTIDHPKAHEWLRKLDQVQMGAQTVMTRRPAPQQYAPAMAGGYAQAPAPVVQEDVKRVGVGSVILAFIGGLVGAALGAAIWAVVAAVTEYEIGWIAGLVGLLAGGGAVLFSGGRRGIAIQIVAIIMALVGVAVGKYAAVYLLGLGAAMAEGATVNDMLAFAPPLDSETISLIVEDIRAAAAPIDLLFIVMAVLAAFAIARQRKA